MAKKTTRWWTTINATSIATAITLLGIGYGSAHYFHDFMTDKDVDRLQSQLYESNTALAKARQNAIQQQAEILKLTQQVAAPPPPPPTDAEWNATAGGLMQALSLISQTSDKFRTMKTWECTGNPATTHYRIQDATGILDWMRAEQVKLAGYLQGAGIMQTSGRGNDEVMFLKRWPQTKINWQTGVVTGDK